MNANVWHSVHEFSLKDSDLEVGNKFSEWDRGRILYNFCVGFEVKGALDLVGRGEENKLPWLPVRVRAHECAPDRARWRMTRSAGPDGAAQEGEKGNGNIKMDGK